MNEDGTFSAVRGGLTWLSVGQIPASLMVSVLVEIPPGLNKGNHAATLVVTSPAGRILLNGEIYAISNGEPLYIYQSINFPLAIDSYGHYAFEVRGALHGSAALDIRNPSGSAVN